MTLVRPPALPYETAPDQYGSRINVAEGFTSPGSLIVGVGSNAVRVAPADRLPLAAAIAGDAGLVFAVPEGGLPEVERSGLGLWSSVDGEGEVGDHLSTPLLLAVAVARAKAEAASPVALPELAGLAVGSVAVCRHPLDGDKAWVGTYVKTAPGTWTPVRHAAEGGAQPSGWVVVHALAAADAATS